MIMLSDCQRISTLFQEYKKLILKVCYLYGENEGKEGEVGGS